MEGSTGDLFVQRRCPRAQRVLFATPEQAVNALRRGRIDVVLDDAPTIWRFAALHESDGLVGRFTPLTEEYLSWAGSRSNPGLLSQVNQTLTGWRDSGELDRILDRWLPSSQP
jgi:ABC-type amino acid transport substrate-binding protein